TTQLATSDPFRPAPFDVSLLDLPGVTLADGVHTFTAVQTDAAGNTGSASITVTLDRQPPPATIALAADTGASASDGVTQNETVTGTGDPNTAVVFTENGAVVGQATT